MSLGAFWGAAAESTDESLRRWKQLFLQKQELEDRRQQFYDSQRFALEREETRFKQAIDLEHLRSELARKAGDREAQLQVGMKVLEAGLEGNLPLQSISNLRDLFNEFDMPIFGELIPPLYQQFWFKNRDEVVSFYNQLVAAASDPEAAMRFDPMFADEAFRLISYIMRWDEDQQKEYRNYWNELVEAARGLRDKVSEATAERLQLLNRELLANISKTETETRSTEVQIAKDLYQLNNIMPLETKRLQRLIDQMDVQLDMDRLALKFQPEILALQVSSMQAQLRKEEAEADVLERTVDALVETAINQARESGLRVEMTAEELEIMKSRARVQLATEVFQISLKKAEVEELEANVEQIYQTILESQERIASSQLDRQRKEEELKRFQNDAFIAIVDVMAALMNEGQVEILEGIGPKLLDLLGLEDSDEIFEQWMARASQMRGRRDIAEELSTRLLAAQVAQEEFKAEIAPEEWEHSREMEYRRVVAYERLANAQANWYDAQARNLSLSATLPETTGTAMTSPEELFKAASGGLSITTWIGTIKSLNERFADPLLIENIQDQAALEGLGMEDFYMIEDITRRYISLAIATYGISLMDVFEGKVPFSQILPPGINPDSLVGQLILQRMGFHFEANTQTRSRPPADVSSIKEAAEIVVAAEDAGERMDILDFANAIWAEMDQREREKYEGGPLQVAHQIRQERDEIRRQQEDTERAERLLQREAERMFGFRPMTPAGVFTFEERERLWTLAFSRFERVGGAMRQIEEMIMQARESDDPNVIDPGYVDAIMANLGYTGFGYGINLLLTTTTLGEEYRALERMLNLIGILNSRRDF